MSGEHRNDCPCARDCERHGHCNACEANHKERGYPPACRRDKADVILHFILECGTFYLATVDEGKPRVRPFGAVCLFDGKMYISTSNQKPVSVQMKANPDIEISATAADGRWLRLTAKALPDNNRAARQAMLNAVPAIPSMYHADDGLFEVFFLKEATADICTLDGESVRYSF